MGFISDLFGGENGILNTAFSWGLDMIGNKATGDQNYEYQRRLQKHDFDFQREMWDKQLEADNTAIQRRMADADEAGLNAHLLFNNGGSGASTPSVSGGSSGGSVGMQAPNTAASLMYALQKQRQDAELDNIKADTDLKDAQSGKTKAEKSLVETTEKINQIMAEAELKEKNAHTKRDTAEAIKQEYYNAYVQTYGHAPDADAMTKIGAKLERFLENGTNWAGSKVNTFIQSNLKR